MEVFLANEQGVPVDEARLTGLARHVLSLEDVGDDAELSILLVTSDHIHRLNARFAGEDYATDVLAFPMMEADDEDDEGSWLLGDVVACPQVAQENALRLQRSLESELDTILVHGILHLLGYDHQSGEERARMDGRVSEVVGSFEPSRA